MRIQHCGLVNGFLPMSHAVRLLATTALTLEEIALRVGLQNRAQMGAAFRRLYGSLQEPIAASLRHSDSCRTLSNALIFA